jgi:ABC-type multidrug transport system ATPase subunit
MAMLLGLLQPSSGEIELFGHTERRALVAARARIGSMIEAPAFYPFLTATQNLRVFGSLLGPPDDGEIERLLALVGLAGARDRRFETYSVGMKQRLALARAMLGQPELILLDEPTSGLDPMGVREVRTIVRQLTASGTTVVLSSHQLGEIEQLCSAVAIMANGRLVHPAIALERLRRPSRYLVRTTDQVAAARLLRGVLFESPGHEGTDSEGALEVALPEHRLPEISQALAAEDVHLVELSRAPFSLEALYLEALNRARTAEPEATGNAA